MTKEQRDLIKSNSELNYIYLSKGSIEIDKRLLEDEYEKKKANLKQRLKLLQERCPHSLYEHHPDPSGNNDSYNTCLICGMES